MAASLTGFMPSDLIKKKKRNFQRGLRELSAA
jgi:hypothetical protein